MRGKKAKALRKQVYGDLVFRNRQYHVDKNGTIHADYRRKAYQHFKKLS